MSTKNVDTMRAAHESWNRRDFAGLVRNVADNMTYTDHARNLTLNSRDKFKAWTEEWAKGMTDGRISHARYIDAGDTVIAEFIAEGTNDGPFGPFAATGKRLSLPFCEIARFDKQGRVVSGVCYYDQLTILTQLGHAKPMSTAA
jgi:steroid delta-isomerase-like uncharacterized protein